MRLVVAGDVIESITLGKTLHAIQTAIVEHPNFIIGVIELLDVLVSVLEDFKGFVAAREVDIDERQLVRRMRVFLDQSFVLLNIEILADISNDKEDEEVDFNEAKEEAEPINIVSDQICFAV